MTTLVSCGSGNVTRKKINVVQSQLESAYSIWKDTPYSLGGESKRGLDCSAFIQIVMRDYFNVRLPRTTREQLKSGMAINPKHLLPGDLVFFQTGRNTYHAGIIIYGGKFMHASTSKGVTISKLSLSYWSKRYIGARRVL